MGSSVETSPPSAAGSLASTANRGETQNQREVRDAYDRDGFVFPIDIMSPSEAAGYRAELEDVERNYPEHAPLTDSIRNYGFVALPFMDKLIRHEAILAAVTPILGRDLMVWGASWFIKEPRTTNFVSWHQDLHYWGLNADDEITAWLALSPATAKSGCMRFVAGSHRHEHVPHRDTFEAEQHVDPRAGARRRR